MQDTNELITNSDTVNSSNSAEQPAAEQASPADTEPRMSQQEAEKRMEALFALASSQNPRGKSKTSTISPKALEVLGLEIASIILFFMTMNKGLPSAFSPIAILLPAIAGICYRLIKEKLSLRDAVSECKPHIALSAFFLFCVLLSFM